MCCVGILSPIFQNDFWNIFSPFHSILNNFEFLMFLTNNFFMGGGRVGWGWYKNYVGLNFVPPFFFELGNVKQIFYCLSRQFGFFHGSPSMLLNLWVKRLLGQTKLWTNILSLTKYFGSKLIAGFLGPTNYLGSYKFWFSKIWDQQKLRNIFLGSKAILGSTKIWVNKFVGSKYLFFWSKNC